MITANESPPRFLVDHMLGRLVTWLRLLGCDTVYTNTLDDAAIAHLAQQDGRVVLTRDRELARRKNTRSVLIASERVMDQLAQVMRECGLGADQWPARCSVCNVVLEELPKEEARGRVPPYVFRTQARFLACPGCGHVYWRGTHWKGMRRRLARIVGDVASGAR